jgi:hypothetical protein
MDNENATNERGFAGYTIGRLDEEGFFGMLGFGAYF